MTIRTLDPPLHEFLPQEKDAQADLAKKIGVPADKIATRIKELHELNPMLGFRGCRLGIVFPEITEMQCRAVFEAACNVQKSGIKVEPEIMIPLVGFLPELKRRRRSSIETAKEVFREGRRSRSISSAR